MRFDWLERAKTLRKIRGKLIWILFIRFDSNHMLESNLQKLDWFEICSIRFNSTSRTSISINSCCNDLSIVSCHLSSICNWQERKKSSFLHQIGNWKAIWSSIQYFLGGKLSINFLLKAFLPSLLLISDKKRRKIW